jgi:hypothetical protein
MHVTKAAVLGISVDLILLIVLSLNQTHPAKCTHNIQIRNQNLNIGLPHSKSLHRRLSLVLRPDLLIGLFERCLFKNSGLFELFLKSKFDYFRQLFIIFGVSFGIQKVVYK